VGEFFHAADFFVGHLLDFFEGALLLVLANLFFFGHLLEGFVAVAADVADGGAVLLEVAVDVLADLSAALLGHGRDGDAENLAVGDGIEAEIGDADGLLDFLEDVGIIGRDDDELRLWRTELRELIDGGGRAVVVHLDLVEHVDAGAAGAGGGQAGLEGGYRAVHAAAEIGVEFFERRNTGHDRDCHRVRPHLLSTDYISESGRWGIWAEQRTGGECRHGIAADMTIHYIVIQETPMPTARRSRAFTISMPPDMAAAAQALAKLENRTMSELMREAFRAYDKRQVARFIDEMGEYAKTRNPMGYTEEDIPRLVKEVRTVMRAEREASAALARS